MILVLNAGSSSLKFAVFGEDLKLHIKGQVAGVGSSARFEVSSQKATPVAAPDLPAAQTFLVSWLAKNGFDPRGFDGIGHRIVHGGSKYVAPIRVDDSVQRDLDALRALAPLHLPFGLGVLKHMRDVAPDVPQIACFDTAFHATQPDAAVRLPLPRAYHERGYRRYGFHGLNYEHVVEAMPKPLPRRLLAAHLGSGASMCAILEGKSVATTMGYSTADGLVMGTRTGAIDPGVLIALMRDEGLGIPELEDLLYRKSGLLGLSGISGDMRTLLASDKPEAREAIDYYCYWAARYAGSLVSAMGGLDAMVFTGGVGENAAPVREKILANLAWLKLPLEAVHIVPANEELAIARHTSMLVFDEGRRPP